MPSEVELEVQNVGWLLEAQRVGAETITNICTIEDEGWCLFKVSVLAQNGNVFRSVSFSEKSENVEDDVSEEESVHDYDMTSSHSSTNLQNTDKLPSDVLEAIKSLGFVEKIWQRAQPIAENVADILKEAEQSLLNK